MNADDLQARRSLFWALAEPLLDRPDVERGTLMGGECLRHRGAFLATVHRRTGDLIVKLDEARVAELINAGVGHPFAPAGKVFREWVAIRTPDPELWTELLAEAQEHQTD